VDGEDTLIYGGPNVRKLKRFPRGGQRGMLKRQKRTGRGQSEQDTRWARGDHNLSETGKHYPRATNQESRWFGGKRQKRRQGGQGLGGDLTLVSTKAREPEKQLNSVKKKFEQGEGGVGGRVACAFVREVYSRGGLPERTSKDK